MHGHRRPLVGLALSVVAGMALAATRLLPFEAWLFAAAGLVLLSAALRRSRASTPLVFLAVAAVAALRFLVDCPLVSPADIGHLRSELPLGNVRLVGRVDAPPAFLAYRSGSLGRLVFPVRCEAIERSGGWRRLRGSADVYMAAVPPGFDVPPGSRIVLAGDLRAKNYPGGNPAELRVEDPRACSILPGSVRRPVADWIRRWSESSAQRLGKDLERLPVHHAILEALVLGERRGIPQETYARFRRTGTLHIFAISGLHVGIVSVLLAGGLMAAGIPRNWLGVWMLPLLLLYVASTGMKPSALRALVMAGVFLLAPLFRRQPDVPSSVAFAAILLLLIRPLDLLSAGFVLSFLVVAFIVMVFSAVPPAWRVGGVRGYCISLAVCSFAASLASMPLVALYFGTFSPSSLIGNLAVVPLTFCIVVCGWLSLLLPMASGAFNHAAAVSIGLLLRFVQGLDGLPGAHCTVETPSPLAVALWYASIVFLFAHARGAQRIHGLLGAAAALLWMALA